MNYSSLPLLERGVYRAPMFNPRHQLILFAVNSDHCWVENTLTYLPPDTSEAELERTAGALWRMLSVVDPISPAVAALTVAHLAS